jgi:hypothetical protein
MAGGFCVFLGLAAALVGMAAVKGRNGKSVIGVGNVAMEGRSILPPYDEGRQKSWNFIGI